MKYDSGMTHFHENIIAALRHMLGNNSEITKNFSPNDASPAPLRDYLKEKYGKSYTSHIGNGMRYSCKTSTGFELAFNPALNNSNDYKYLTLSWSQTAKFIRDNWDEVFAKAKPKTCKETTEKQPSYLDKLREKYPSINEADEWIGDWYCPSDLFNGDGVPAKNSNQCSMFNSNTHCLDCWNSPCAADAVLTDDLDMFEEDYFEQYPAEDTAETDKSLETQVTATTETALQNVFDYSELDSDTADKLRAVSERVISIKATYIIETAKQVKAAHDLLANHYKGLWGAWCESVGFSRHTGTNLVHVAETFPDLDVVENFDNIDRSLLYAASKPSAPPELVEQVKNGDITTHKDYITLKKQLEEANKRAENAERDAVEYASENEKNAAKLAAEAAKTDELLLHIKELENRPIDVCVDNNEVTKRVTEAVNKINSETEKTLAAREQEFAETLHFKDERIWELEDKLKELNTGGTDKKVYMVSMTEKDYQKMILELSGGLCKILSSAVVVDLYGKRGNNNG